jgi:DNA polymerase-4
MKSHACVVHINVVGFAAAVGIAGDPSLADKVFVVAGGGVDTGGVDTGGTRRTSLGSGRTVVLGVSPRARDEGLEPGMSLAAAERQARNVLVLPPDPQAWTRANAEMERIALGFTPTVENDLGGHLYLDLRGTSLLFGQPEDCASRIRRIIATALSLDPAVGVAKNKLTAKVVTRTLRPRGFAVVPEGSEADFLYHQDIRLLPGIGPSLIRVLSVAGIRDIGGLAALGEGEALALLGRRGLVLRDAARGIDGESVASTALGEQRICRTLDFRAHTLETEVIRGALMSLAEDAGMELRFRRLRAGRMDFSLTYADGVRREVSAPLSRPVCMDRDLIPPAEGCRKRAQDRRVRVRALGLVLRDLRPDRVERDLFEPEADAAQLRLQGAIDSSRRRYGSASLLRGTSLWAQNSDA